MLNECQDLILPWLSLEIYLHYCKGNIPRDAMNMPAQMNSPRWLLHSVKSPVSIEANRTGFLLRLKR